MKTSKERCTSLWNLHQRKTFFVVDVSINQTTGRRWQTKLLDTWKVAQIHLLRQESVVQKVVSEAVHHEHFIQRFFIQRIVGIAVHYEHFTEKFFMERVISVIVVL